MSAEPAAVGPLPGEGENPAVVLDVVAAVYRLIKLTRMYEENNQALMTGAESLVNAIQAFTAAHRTGSADLLFASDTVFVNGEMPRLSRDAYTRTMELAELLDKAGVSSVTFPKSATASDLVSFMRAVAAAIREPARQAELTDKAGVRGIRARRLRSGPASPKESGDNSPAGRVVRTYACAIVLLRRLHGEYAKGGPEKVPPGLPRLAQRIVSHVEEEPALLVALAASKSRENDEASVAVVTALVAVLMAKQVTKDRAAMASVVQAALLYHLGRARLEALRTEPSVTGVVSPLSDTEQDRIPASGAAAVAALDRADATTLPRVVIAFEAQWMRRSGRLGALYRGKRATSVLGRILSVARSFAELMAPGAYAAAMGPEDAIHFLASRANDEQDRAYVKLLTGGLGVFPPGTMVELSTGEVAVVMRVPEEPVDFARPPVRVLYDDAGNLLDQPFDVDLASPSSWGATQRLIKRNVDSDEQQTQAMRAYVLSVTRGDTTEQRKAKSASDSQSGKRPIGSQPDLAGDGVLTGVIPASKPGVVPPAPVSSGSRLEGALRESAFTPAPVSVSRASSPSAPSAPTSSASTTARRRRSFEERPKVYDPRAEPDDPPPARATLTIPQPPRREPKPQEAIATRPAIEAVRPPEPRATTAATRPALEAVRPVDPHQMSTAPPPPDTGAEEDPAATRGFQWANVPNEARRETSPVVATAGVAKALVAKSSVAGTRKVAWEDYGKLTTERDEVTPVPGKPRLDESSYDAIVDGDDPHEPSA